MVDDPCCSEELRYVSHSWHLSESESESVGEVPVWGRSGELVWGCVGDAAAVYGDFLKL